MFKVLRSLMGKTPQGMIVEAVAGKVIDKLEDKLEEAVKDKVEDIKSSALEAVAKKSGVSSALLDSLTTEPLDQPQKKRSGSGSKAKG